MQGVLVGSHHERPRGEEEQRAHRPSRSRAQISISAHDFPASETSMQGRAGESGGICPGRDMLTSSQGAFTCHMPSRQVREGVVDGVGGISRRGGLTRLQTCEASEKERGTRQSKLRSTPGLLSCNHQRSEFGPICSLFTGALVSRFFVHRTYSWTYRRTILPPPLVLLVLVKAHPVTRVQVVVRSLFVRMDSD